MDRQIRRLAVAFLVLFLLLLGQLTYLQVFASEKLANNPANQRVLLEEYDVDRGNILARDERTVLARSRPTKGRLKYLRVYPRARLYSGVTGYYSVVFGRYGLEGLTDLTPDTFDCIHGGIDTTFAKADPDRIVPVDVMRQLEQDGRIGGLFPFFYATSGGGTPMPSAERFAREIFADIQRGGGAGGAILTAT